MTITALSPEHHHSKNSNGEGSPPVSVAVFFYYTLSIRPIDFNFKNPVNGYDRSLLHDDNLFVLINLPHRTGDTEICAALFFSVRVEVCDNHLWFLVQMRRKVT